MRVGHDEAVIADDSTAFGGGAAVDGNALADGGVVTDDGEGLFTTEFEVLGNGTDDGTGEERVATAHACAGEKGDAVHEAVAFADDDVFVDEAEGAYFATLTNLGFGVDVC